MYDDAVVAPAPSAARAGSSGGRGAADPLLLTELNEYRSRIAHLESLNSSLQGRCGNLERSHGGLLHEQQSTRNALANMQLELRMSRMETEHASRCLREKEAIVAEMQLEIDLVTRSAVDANRRAAEGMEAAQGARSDRDYVDGLEAKVVALQEWALASTESKRLTSERCRGLEGRVKELEGAIRKLHASEGGSYVDRGPSSDGDHPPPLADVVGGGWKPPYPSSGSVAGSSHGGDDHERKLWTRSSSLVVGAGMVGHALLELGQVHIEEEGGNGDGHGDNEGEGDEGAVRDRGPAVEVRPDARQSGHLLLGAEGRVRGQEVPARRRPRMGDGGRRGGGRWRRTRRGRRRKRTRKGPSTLGGVGRDQRQG
jgi:hypothetical protein